MWYKELCKYNNTLQLIFDLILFKLNCKYLGSRVENDIANALAMTPQLVKLGVTMEFRDSLNRTAVQLQKNLDKRKHTFIAQNKTDSLFVV